MMNTVISKNHEFEIDISDGEITVNGNKLDAHFLLKSSDKIDVIFQGKVYRVRLGSFHGNKGSVLINEKEIELFLKSPKQQILEKIGITQESDNKMDDLVAPMPGKILKVLKKSGEQISKSEGILVLEAMKMENVLKASADAVIADVKVSEGDAVEKNQILITFE